MYPSAADARTSSTHNPWASLARWLAASAAAAVALPAVGLAQAGDAPPVRDLPAPVRELPAPAPIPQPTVKPAAAAAVPAARSAPAAPAAEGGGGVAAPSNPQQSNVHGIGVAGSFATGSGLTYRRYFGNTSVQASFLAVITDRGDEAVAFVGASAVQYLLVWYSPGARGLLPASTALRLVGGAHYYLRRWKEDTSFMSSNNFWTQRTEQKRDSSINIGAGLGFEFGGIVRSGFSLSTDLVLTAAIDDAGLEYILPLPQAALVYSW